MRTFRTRQRTAAVALALALVAACGSDTGPDLDAGTPVGPTEGTAPDRSEDPDEAPPGMAWRTVEVVDTTRTTDEVLDADGNVVLDAAATRTIGVELLYAGADGGGEDAVPSYETARPLVLWMKGLGGRSEVGDPILQALYESGYIVAAPNSPEVSAPAASAADFPELPADVSVVLDALLHPADGVADDLAPHIRTAQIGLGGHSIGSTAVRAAAFHDCCRDDRVGAVVSVGSHTAWKFGDSEFDYSGTPLLLVVGDADAISPLEQSEIILAQAAEPTRLLVLPDADHFEPVYDGRATEVGARTIEAIIAFYDAHLRMDGATSGLEDFAVDLPDGTWRSPAA